MTRGNFTNPNYGTKFLAICKMIAIATKKDAEEVREILEAFERTVVRFLAENENSNFKTNYFVFSDPVCLSKVWIVARPTREFLYALKSEKQKVKMASSMADKEIPLLNEKGGKTDG